MNSINLLGNLVADPEIKQYQPGKNVCKFRIAVRRPFNKEVSDYFNITAFGKAGETIYQYFHKGDFIGVSGSMQINSYQDQNGVNKLSPEVLLDRFCFAGATQRANQNQPMQQQQPYPQQQNYQQPQPVQQQQQFKQPQAVQQTMVIDDDFSLIDDGDPLPF